MELVEALIAIMKQHERILDIQLCACSLLLRSLGQGGCGAYSGTLSQTRQSLGNQHWLPGATSSPAMWAGQGLPLPSSTPPCNQQ